MEIQKPVDMSVLSNTAFEDCPIKLWWTHMTPWFEHYGKDPNSKYWYYVPFNITVAHYDCVDFYTYSKEEHCKQISHDICHVLDLFMRGKHDRLLQREMGYGQPTSNGWSIKTWQNEVKVLAMQNALLSDSFPCGYHFKGVALDLFSRVKPEERYPLSNNLQHTQMMEDVFNYWKDSIFMLKDSYRSMCNWIKNHEYFAKQSA
jgi:hypothetical protein